MNHMLRLVVLSFLFVMAACATFVPSAGLFSPQPSGAARIILYRDVGYYAPSTTLTVFLNGNAVGALPRGEVIYRDVPPGTYQVTFNPTRFVPHQFATVKIGAGDVIYVKIEDLAETVCGGSSGGTAGCDATGYTSVIMDPARARNEIQGLRIVAG